MSWLDKLLPPKIKRGEKKASSKVPEGLWVKCDECASTLYSTDLETMPKSAPNAVIICR